MSNMSYCRFQNTYGDFADCVEALEDEGLPDSKRELLALREMVNLCHRLIESVDDEDLNTAIEEASD